MLLARAQRAGSPVVPYAEVDGGLAHLLQEFGPPRKSDHPEYPFWHLESDKVWLVRERASIPLRSQAANPSRAILLAHGVEGEVPAPLWQLLVEDPEFRDELAGRILRDFWPETLHDSLRRKVGLLLPGGTRETVTRARRDARFRVAVLDAFAGACAVCGYDARLADDSMGVEAAHIRWHCCGGPDDLANALALCALHHVALDSGALGIDSRHRVRISAHLAGGDRAQALLHAFAGAPLLLAAQAPRPAPEHLRWHSREVFRSPAA